MITLIFVAFSTVSTAQECTSCHEIRHGLTGNNCDNCHYNTTFSNDKHIEKPFSPGYMHDSFDWEGDNANEQGPDRLNESCPACHANMLEHTKQTLNLCEDCHVKSSIEKSRLILLRDDIKEYIPVIFSHFNGSSIDVPDQSDIGDTRSTCFGFDPTTGEGSCHGTPFGIKDRTGGYFAFNSNYTPEFFKRSDPYHWNGPADFLPDTKDCVFCHDQKDTDIRKAWGDPRSLPSDPAHLDSNNKKCWGCHVQGKFVSFHGKELVWLAEKSNIGNILTGTLVILIVIVILLWRKLKRVQNIPNLI